MKSFRLKTLLWFYLALIFLIISSCGTQGGNNQEISDIHVSKTDQFESVSTDTEDFPLPNCGGSSELSQTLGTQASVKKSVTISGTATIRGGGKVAISPIVQGKLEAEISIAYNETFQSENSRLDSIELKAAPATHVVYIVQWMNKQFKSSVSYILEGKIHDAEYIYALSVPKIKDSYAILCSSPISTNNPIVETTPNIPPVVSFTATSSQFLIHGEVVTANSLARIVGGDPNFWTQRGPAVWGYFDKNHNKIFRHPGDNMVLTYWAGFAEPINAADCSMIVIDAENTRYVKCPPGTLAEFEADGVGLHLIDYTGLFPKK